MTAPKKKASIFARITKVDESSRTVIGRACQEVPDRTGEILDYNTSKPFFQEWARQSSEASMGKSRGNLRTMHGAVAAGKLTGIEFNDPERAIDVTAKVVDDAEWKKVLEGVYTGFSIGGKYVNKWDDPDTPELERYTAQPFEISLVDSPAIPTALFFDVIKADGSIIQKSFAVQSKPAPNGNAFEVSGEDEDVAALAKSMNEGHYSVGEVVKLVDSAAACNWNKLYGLVAEKAAFADKLNRRFPMDTADQVKASWYYANQHTAAQFYDEDELKHILKLVGNAWKKKIDEDGPPLEIERAVTTDDLRKSFYSSSQLAMVVDGLTRMVMSTEYEYVNSEENAGIAVKFRKAVNDLSNVLSSMISAAKDAFNKEPDEDDAPMGMVALAAQAKDLVKLTRIDEDELLKIGSRHNKVDFERIQQMHDMTVQLSAQCGSMRKDKDMSKDDDDARKAAGRAKKPYDDPTAQQYSGGGGGGVQGASVTNKKKDADDDDARKRRDSDDDDDEDDAKKRADSDDDSDAHKRKAKRKDSDDDSDAHKRKDSTDDSCDDDGDGEDGKKAIRASLTKALRGDPDSLVDLITTAVQAGVTEANKPLLKRIKLIESTTPVPTRAVLKAVGKGDDVDDRSSSDTTKPILQNDGKVNEVATEIKKVFQGGGQPLFKFTTERR